tara:strand:- start:6272 stop:6832 length:561 start_codon:yes stop_codon:yes gene_type:complete
MALLGIGSPGSTGTAIVDGTTHALDGAYGNWISYKETGIMYLSHATFDPATTDAEMISPGIRGPWVNGQKIVVGVHIVAAEGTGTSAAGFQIEGSLDGKTWVRIGSELSADLNPEAAANAIHLFTVDLSDYTLPWYRLTMNDDTHDLDVITFKFLVTGVNSDYAEGVALEGTGTSSLIGGIGADPS